MAILVEMKGKCLDLDYTVFPQHLVRVRRVILIIILTITMPHRISILSAFLRAVDPQVFDLGWSIFVFGLWNATFRKSQFSTKIKVTRSNEPETRMKHTVRLQK